MASTSTGELSLPAVFITQTQYPLPSQKFMIPASWRRYQLSQLVNKALGLAKPVPFDFLLKGEILRGSLGEWCKENGAGEVSLASLWKTRKGGSLMKKKSR
jgi:ribosome biogenesis protein YTM1